MKKVLTSMLAVVMVIELIMPTFAINTVRESKIEFLRDCGLPVDFLEGREDDDINALYEIAQSHTIRCIGKQEALLVTDDEMSTYGTISEADMTLTMWSLIVDGSAVNNRYPIESVTLFIDYVWAFGHPFVTKTDGISVNWDSVLFAMEPNSFKSTDYQYITPANVWMEAKSNVAPAKLNQGGLGYSVTLTPIMSGVNQRKGSASFTLLPKKKIYDEKGLVTSINVEYAHDKTPLVGTISFSYAGAGISIGLPTLSDSVVKNQLIDYRS